ncbi:hypothetical protein [Achromobacter aegrifaciens]|uniref:hypothetical protein n=1 Tax=Achromobacter aegrifaciens TaxID=1287736 RepID=UPI0014679F87|nr:hypothetical protein [Achromobacter aegrifaciens]CAB3709794.1 hypothetical protein LMG26852_05673 [Achromobacter aegrifaciens]
MPLYELSADSLVSIPSATYSALNLRERDDIQRLIRDQTEVILPDLFVLTEEFGDWEDSKRRIDLLCLDRDRKLVVVELKRTEDGGHMELQALRYAAMVSTMRFEQAVETHRKYLALRGKSPDGAETEIRTFLDIPEGPVSFADKVRIALVSADFSKEITSTVLWLNAQGLDITCVKARPYPFKDHVLLDVQQVIPLPEAAEYQVAIREKTMDVVAAETQGRDYTRYRLQTNSGQVFSDLPKRRLIFQVVREALQLGVSPERIRDAVPWRASNIFVSVEGNLSGEQFVAVSPNRYQVRYFCRDDELFYLGGRTFALSNQWGLRTEEAVEEIFKCLPSGHGLQYEALA